MKYLHITTVCLFITGSAFAQSGGTVTNHAFPIGKGPGNTGYTSLLCGSAQLAVGQTAADPICQTMSGDGTLSAAGALTITKTGGVVFAPVATSGSASDLTTGTLPIGRLTADATTWRTVTSADPIVNTDCWRTVALGGNALFAETFPASLAGFPLGCRIRVKNTDIYTGPGTGRGKQLINAPSDLFPMLYPQQVLEVQVVNAALVTTLNPGRWINPQTVTLCVDTGGSDTTGDGLVALATAGAGCLRTNAKAGIIILTRFDTNQTTPIIAPTVGQSFTDQLNLGGTPTGSNLIQLSPNGSGNVNWNNAGPCINISDNAQLDIRLNALNAGGNISFTCNTANAVKTGHIYNHNHVVLDLEGGPPIFHLAGANDNAIFWDGKGIATISDGIVIAGTGFSAGYLDQGAKVTWSGSANPSVGISGAPTIAGLWTLNGGSELLVGPAAPTAAGYTSLGPTTVTTNSILITSGLAIPGGVINPATGGLNCIAATNCNPWIAFTPSPSCGTATFTVTSARARTNGKTTEAQLDVTITAIGTCANTIGFTLPNTANSGGGFSGREIAVNGHGMNCNVPSGSATVSCAHADTAAFVVNERVVLSGVYENQ